MDTAPTQIDDKVYVAPFGTNQVDNYSLLELRGKGAFGEVWKAQNLLTGQIVALKIVNVEDPRIAEMIIEEVRVLKEISYPTCHPFLSCFYDYRYDRPNKKVLIEMEYIEGTELQDWITNYRQNPVNLSVENILLLLTTDLVDALKFLHDKGIIHRDIKPNNILITTEYIPKLVDFGLGCDAQRCLNNFCCKGNPGTYYYMAPETIMFKESYFVTDIWSLGVTLYVMATGQYPFDFEFNNTKDIQETIINQIPHKLGTNNYKLNAIVNGCLKKNPNFRMTLEQISEILEN